MPASAWFGATGRATWFATPDHAAEARASAAALGMPDRCAIKGWLTVRNARGNVVDSKEFTRATDVPIRIQRDLRPVFGAESGGVYGRQAETIDTSAQAFQGALPWGTTVLDSDHIAMADGTKYEVTSVDDASSYGVEIVVGLVRLGLDNPEPEGE
jgi:hypothetical protein